MHRLGKMREKRFRQTIFLHLFEAFCLHSSRWARERRARRRPRRILSGKCAGRPPRPGDVRPARDSSRGRSRSRSRGSPGGPGRAGLNRARPAQLQAAEIAGRFSPSLQSICGCKLKGAGRRFRCQLFHYYYFKLFFFFKRGHTIFLCTGQKTLPPELGVSSLANTSDGWVCKATARQNKVQALRGGNGHPVPPSATQCHPVSWRHTPGPG